MDKLGLLTTLRANLAEVCGPLIAEARWFPTCGEGVECGGLVQLRLTRRLSDAEYIAYVNAIYALLPRRLDDDSLPHAHLIDDPAHWDAVGEVLFTR